ncbi:MAG: hypothetical protein ACK53Y_22290, partial [bacterium]
MFIPNEANTTKKGECKESNVKGKHKQKSTSPSPKSSQCCINFAPYTPVKIIIGGSIMEVQNSQEIRT